MIKRLKDYKTLRLALRKDLCLLLLICSVSAFSQPSKTQYSVPDTSKIKAGSNEAVSEGIHSVKADTLPDRSLQRSEETKDTTGTIDPFYRSLQKKAEKNKLLQLLYNLIVVSPSTAPSASDTSDFTESEKEYYQYRGKTIANIRLKKVDILSGSVKDTLRVMETGFTRLLNKLHVTTRDRVIYNNLLFKEGDQLDPYAISDSERLLRGLSFIQDAKIYVDPQAGNNELVDDCCYRGCVFHRGNRFGKKSE